MQRRDELLISKDVPYQNEVKQNWGAYITKILFDGFSEHAKNIMGTKEILKGPQEALWISPSDQLDGKVILTIPLTRKYVGALTHKGILELGEGVMLRYEKRMQDEKDQAIFDAVAEQKTICMEQTRTMTQCVKREAFLEYNQQRRQLIKQFNTTIKNAVDVTKLQYEKKMRATIQRERCEIQEFLQDQKKVSLLRLEKHLLSRFQVNELEKLNFLNWEYQTFLLEFKQEEEEKLKSIVEQFENEIERIKAEKVCPNCAQMARKMKQREEHYQAEKKRLTFKYESKITKLKGLIEKLRCRIEQITVQKINVEKKIKVWKNNIKSLIKEFQKFINYALNATPGQAEFLLSFNKLLAAEAEKTAALADKKPKKSTAQTVAEEILESIICAAMEAVPEESEISSEAEQITKIDPIKITKGIMDEILERAEEEIQPDIVEEILENIVCEAVEASTTVNQIKLEILQRAEKQIMAPGTEAVNIIFSHVFAILQKTEIIRQDIEIVSMEDKAVQIDIDEEKQLKDAATTMHFDASTDTADRGKINMPTTEAFLKKRVDSLLSIFQKHASLTNVFIAPGSVHTKYK